jgi:glycerophosphoryl diester phosphodiesterase
MPATAQVLPRVIAHRGAKHATPENTVAAFDRGLEEGADGIELDIRLTRDGIPAIFHDHTLRKLGDRRTRFSDLTLAELRQRDFGGWFDPGFSGEPVPTLEEVLERYGRRTELCLEIKTARDARRNVELVEKTVGLVRDAGVAANVFILCFDASLLTLVHAQMAELRCVYNALGCETALQGAAMMPWLHGVDVDIRWLTPEAGEQLRRNGRSLMSYTCNTEAQLHAARAAGVQAVITNFPARSRAFLRR